MKKKLFIVLFLLSLVGPTLVWPFLRGHLDDTNYENRQLAEFPELSAENFEQIPSQFEAYYNDHVPFKNLFVKVKTKLDLKLLGQSSNSAVTVGEDNWMFYTSSIEGEDALADYQRTNLYTEEQEEALKASILSAKEQAESRGMRFFVFQAPNKETIYGEYMPDSTKQFGEVSRLDAVIPRLQEAGLPVYDMKAALLEAKDVLEKKAAPEAESELAAENGDLPPTGAKQNLYYKYDTHWNQIGAFAGSQMMSEILTGTGVPFEAVDFQPEIHCSGDMARMLNLAEEYSDDWTWVTEDYLPEITAECVEGTPAGEFSVFESDSSNEKTLLLVGDSFSQALKPYLAKLYRRTIFVTIETYEKSVLENYPADDFVYLTVERNQKQFEDMGNILLREEAEGGIRQTTDGV